MPARQRECTAAVKCLSELERIIIGGVNEDAAVDAIGNSRACILASGNTRTCLRLRHLVPNHVKFDDADAIDDAVHDGPRA